MFTDGCIVEDDAATAGIDSKRGNTLFCLMTEAVSTRPTSVGVTTVGTGLRAIDSRILIWVDSNGPEAISKGHSLDGPVVKSK